MSTFFKKYRTMTVLKKHPCAAYS